MGEAKRKRERLELVGQDGEMTAERPVPKHVAIVGLGPSSATYLDIIKRLGGRNAYCDEVWAINAMGNTLVCDRIFHMDDVRIQEARAAAHPDSNIAAMVMWLRSHPGPIYTSRLHPDYPGLVEFPLEDVLNNLGHDYLNNTAAYAVAYAIYIGVEQISLYGCDYTYPNSHHAERGRGCVEFLLGIATSRGIKVTLPKDTSLLDALEPREKRIYGYDTLHLDFSTDPETGRLKVAFRERDAKEVPSAEEIEDRYDHSHHPNSLVSGKAA